MNKGFLILETGEVFEGKMQSGFSRAGEVVFNTSHSGYEEIATDPSYFSQIVVLTAPMQGNYGVDDRVWESRKIWIEGFVSLQCQPEWQTRLAQHQISTLTEVDTRAITLRLRSQGTPWGALVSASTRQEAEKQAAILISEKKKIEKDWVYLASRKEMETRVGAKANGPKIAVLDFGAKENILRELAKEASQLFIFPSRASSEDILKSKPDGLMLTNGPGDPSDVKVAPQTVKELIGKLPIFGICMGHQILALALGGKTYRLKFGHRGSNHPIQDQLLNRAYVTSQNHGYAVMREGLPEDVKITHINLNDESVAGFYSATKRCLGIQFHPESHPGPHEARQLFQFFMKEMI
jgi:carbamoyl-phosphate synthase small subunit